MPRPRFLRTAAIFGVLRDPELRALWFSDWISDVGNFITFIALAVYINQLTGTATAVGVALALRSVPWFTVGPFAGLLADRLDRRRLVIATNLIRAVLVALLPFTNAAWQAYALALASSTFAPVHRPARSALLAQVAPEGKLVPALAVLETTHQVLHTVGPAIGGLTVFLVGARHAFFVDAASFVIAAGFQARIRSRGRAAASSQSALADIREGMHALFTARAARAYTLLNGALALGYSGMLALLVVYIREDLGQPGGMYGLVLSVAGLGTVMTSLVIAARDEHHPRTPWAVASVAGVAAFALVWFRPPLPLLLPVALGFGLVDAGSGIPMTATLAETLPDQVRGRAYGAVQALTELLAAIGSFGFAWLGDPRHLGVVSGLTLSAGTGALFAVIMLSAGGVAAISRHEHARLSATRPRPAG